MAAALGIGIPLQRYLQGQLDLAVQAVQVRVQGQQGSGLGGEQGHAADQIRPDQTKPNQSRERGESEE